MHIEPIEFVVILLANRGGESHSSYSIWFEESALALVISWPAAGIDRFLVLFQGEAGGGWPAEGTERPTGG